MNYLVTGAAGFIGFHVSLRLLKAGYRVTGVDNLNDYYDVQLKKDRIRLLEAYPDFTFQHTDIADRTAMEQLFGRVRFDRVIHLAAQAGVRYSIENPHAYVDANIVGHLNILEGCRQQKVGHLLFASSSSVYG
ncbi:UDP-glucose 4-epimerase [Tatumella ptyseos]|nr:UDP-glucose 4-epimerase [Tatumella ptyseos]